MKRLQTVLVILTVVALVAGAAWAGSGQAASKPPEKKPVAAQPAAPATPAKPAAQPATPAHEEHGLEATGTVVSSSATSLVVSRMVKGKKTETTFAVTPDTQRTGGDPAPGARVEVHYRMEKNQRVATQIEVRGATATSQPGTKKKN